MKQLLNRLFGWFNPPKISVSTHNYVTELHTFETDENDEINRLVLDSSGTKLVLYINKDVEEQTVFKSNVNDGDLFKLFIRDVVLSTFLNERECNLIYETSLKSMIFNESNKEYKNYIVINKGYKKTYIIQFIDDEFHENFL